MNDLPAAIRVLTDTEAERLLATLARHRLQPGAGAVTTCSPEVVSALAQTVGDVPPSGTATRGELARATLLLLATDPALQPQLDALIRNPSAEKYAADPITLTLVATAAVLALQTHVKIEYDDSKGWRVKFEKPTADKTLMGQVVGLLQRLFPHS